MDNQHKKISGYRELTQEEIDLMNEIKAMGGKIQSLINKVNAHVMHQHTKAAKHSDINEDHRLFNAQAERWIDLALTDYQVAQMKLTRAVAQPTNF